MAHCCACISIHALLSAVHGVRSICAVRVPCGTHLLLLMTRIDNTCTLYIVLKPSNNLDYIDTQRIEFSIVYE